MPPRFPDEEERMREIDRQKRNPPALPDVPPAQVEWLAKVRQSPARTMLADVLHAEMTAAMARSAAYFTPPEPHEQAEFEAIFQEAYPNFNPAEITAALRMNAGGKLDLPTERGVFYGNKFNISTMCAILNAYQEWRQKVVAAIVNAEDEERRERERQAQKMAWIEALAAEKSDFLSGNYSGVSSWQDIPPYWFDWATEAGLLTWEKGEKLKRVEAAKQEAENELKAENENRRRSGRAGEVLQCANFTDSVESRARVIQRKRAVWDKLVNK